MTRPRGTPQHTVDQATTIDALLRRASKVLSSTSGSARLDAELLLADALACSRTHLYTWPEQTVPDETAATFRDRIERRRQGVPVAQLLGRRAFLGLTLRVTPDTLIPRPETERLVEIALECLATVARPRVVDLGTGTGAIALAVADARPDAHVDAVEASPEALAVARENAASLGLGNVRLLSGNWLEPVTDTRYHAILANPPYVAATEAALTSPETRFEPYEALYAADNGLAALKQIVGAAPAHLLPGGWLVLEHGFRQGAAVRALLTAAGLDSVTTHDDLAGHERVTLGRWPGNTEGGSQ